MTVVPLLTLELFKIVRKLKGHLRTGGSCPVSIFNLAPKTMEGHQGFY